MAEAKKVFEEMEESIDKMKRDRNTVTKYMKKIGFQLPSMQEWFHIIAQNILHIIRFEIYDKNLIKEPEDFFGPNIGRLYGWINESDKKSIMEADILPSSDLSPNDLFLRSTYRMPTNLKFFFS